MTQDEIVEITKRSGLGMLLEVGGMDKCLEHFAKLVAAKEREKTLQLWMLLDDIDTVDDIAKADDAVYRSLCRQAHAKRWFVLTGDEVDAAIRARGEA
jgi:hypothetical protein